MIMKKLSYILSLLVMTLMVSCNDDPTPTPTPSDDPETPQVLHTITLDFEKAIPYHTNVSAQVTLREWNAESKNFVDSVIVFDLNEVDFRFDITSNDKSMLTDCVVAYRNLSQEDKSYQAKFGREEGDDKSETTYFDRNKTYAWNDNAHYMVLQ